MPVPIQGKIVRARRGLGVPAWSRPCSSLRRPA